MNRVLLSTMVSALALGVWQGVASASPLKVSWAIKGSYKCSANCDFTIGNGTAPSGSVASPSYGLARATQGIYPAA